LDTCDAGSVRDGNDEQSSLLLSSAPQSLSSSLVIRDEEEVVEEDEGTVSQSSAGEEVLERNNISSSSTISSSSSAPSSSSLSSAPQPLSSSLVIRDEEEVVVEEDEGTVSVFKLKEAVFNVLDAYLNADGRTIPLKEIRILCEQYLRLPLDSLKKTNKKLIGQLAEEWKSLSSAGERSSSLSSAPQPLSSSLVISEEVVEGDMNLQLKAAVGDTVPGIPVNRDSGGR
jgi:hypothetical protein